MPDVSRLSQGPGKQQMGEGSPGEWWGLWQTEGCVPHLKGTLIWIQQMTLSGNIRLAPKRS